MNAANDARQQRQRTNKDYYTAVLPLKADASEAEGGEAAAPRFTVQELIDHLVHNNETLTGRDLFILSDLTRQDMELVRQDWTLIPVEQRRQLVETLVELAEEDVDWHIGRVLRVAMQDPDAGVRQQAIEGLWEETSSDLIGPLVQLLLNDPVVGVRAAAAGALGDYVLAGELDELDAALAMRAEDALLSVLENPDEESKVQARALESIAYSGETGIRQLIEDAYYSPDEELRVSALVAMGRSADIRWRGLVRAELQNPAPAMRAEAARACGELESKKAEPELLELLVDDVPEVRLAAIFALGRLGGKRAQAALRALTETEDLVESEAADLALEEMLFFSGGEEVPLYDETTDDLDGWDVDPWMSDDLDDNELGSYAN